MSQDDEIRYFKDRYLNDFWDHVRFWFFMRKLYWVKRISLWEGLLDKMYFENKFSKEVAYDERTDRTELEEQNRLPYNKQDQTKVFELESRISRNKAIKQSYRQNETFLADTKKYVEMLEMWFGLDREDETKESNETEDQV